jgi:uncharacterized membrane protein
MARRLGVLLAAAAIVTLGILEAALGVGAEQTAAHYPEVDGLRFPVLALAVAFCAVGQVASLVALLGVGRATRPVVAVLLLVMAALLVAIVAVTMAWNATPPLVALGGWGGAILLTAGAGVIALGRQPGSTPAARAGSA